jgi:hypothetical protein
MVILKAGDYRCPYDNSSSVDLSSDFDWGAGFRTWLPNLHWSVLFPPEVLVWRQQLWQALEMPFLESTGTLGAVDFQIAWLHLVTFFQPQTKAQAGWVGEGHSKLPAGQNSGAVLQFNCPRGHRTGSLGMLSLVWGGRWRDKHLSSSRGVRHSLVNTAKSPAWVWAINKLWGI